MFIEARKKIALAIGLLAAAGAAPLFAAETADDRERAAAGHVQDALRNEITGKTSERNHSLTMALQQSAKYEPALWHSGQVKFENEWLNFREVPAKLSGRTNLAAYRTQRGKAENTVASQLALADWCAKRRMPEQERAHLTKVLELEPEHPDARRRLDFVRVDNTWLTRQQVEASGKAAEVASAAYKKWQPKLENIHRGFQRRDPAQRQAAAELVEAIDDPAAIPAMESILSASSEEEAEVVVQTVAKMPATEASLSLARHAVYAKWPNTRELAADELRLRDEQTFMPVLLSAMTTPIQTRAELYNGPGGRLMYGHAFFREGQDRKQMAVLVTGFNAVDGTNPANIGVPIAEEQARNREAAVEVQNRLTQWLNARIIETLAHVTKQDFGQSPDLWWAWWNTHNEVYISEKPTDTAFAYNEIQIATPVPVSEGTLDCLTRGTPVWTESGSMPIEKIQVGDRVLSQDPETGELTYKPVLRTTVRPVGAIIEISLGKEEVIRCSGGHPLWVSGTGWVKAREIQPGMQMHAVGGSASVTAVEKRGLEETYNLVVADFNTYFVGQARVLSHDNTVRRPTAMIVPGLVKK